MTTRDLWEIIVLVISGGAAVATGAFSFATKHYLNEIKDFKRQIKNDAYEVNEKALKTIENCTTEIRKLQQNHDNLLNQVGTLKCDVRDNRAALEKEGFIHTRVGFPEDNIPKRTGWTIEDA